MTWNSAILEMNNEMFWFAELIFACDTLSLRQKTVKNYSNFCIETFIYKPKYKYIQIDEHLHVFYSLQNISSLAKNPAV